MRILVLLIACLLAACRAPLLDDMELAQANRAVAMLEQHGIGAEKELRSDGRWTVQVGSAQLAVASDLSAAYGLSRTTHAGLGTLYAERGLLSTPLETQARLLYGLNEEMAQTLEQIEGVVAARVHYALPAPRTDEAPSTSPAASVLIRHRSEFDLAAQARQIRALVAASVDGLRVDRVELLLVEVVPAATPVLPCDAGQSCATNATGPSPWMPFGLGLLALAAVCAWALRYGASIPLSRWASRLRPGPHATRAGAATAVPGDMPPPTHAPTPPAP